VYYNNKYHKGEVEKSIGCGSLQSDTHLLNHFINVISNEIQSYSFYQKLNELTTNNKYKRIILNIQQDEVKHLHWANMFLDKLGENKPQVPEGEIPKEFDTGLKKAIHDKLETISYYRHIANKATNLIVYIYFIHMAHEEHRHKSCLEYMLYDIRNSI
jgi:rubrerythrin